LEQVIVALNQKKKNKQKNLHVPYRNSLLTLFLKDSLGGNCKTVMIATLSMDGFNQDETVSTLRFAQRVKLIENEVSVNEKTGHNSRMEALIKENAVLRKKLAKI
jgi:kinesin family protein 6/9